ncbi:RNA polymerase factor sigma-54 [Lysobacter korlensis]|uniref:RNA polymerase sigma-54 factor n=1 Tax=Lysobacter korlensis TaxID=553636 RepID=A0ABV6RKH2_9GAMM
MKNTMRAQLGQTVNLTPQLLQAIRLLQLTAPQLELEMRQALERNPLLETEEDEIGETDAESEAVIEAATVEAAAWDELPEPSFLSGGGAIGEDDATARIAAGESTDARVRLLDQLRLSWDDGELAMAAFWLDHCDDRGYLELDREALLAEGASALDVAIDGLEAIRQRLLHGDCPGLAAMDPSECLRAQLAVLRPSAERALALRIVREHLGALASQDHSALATALGVDGAQLRSAIALILSLRAHPLESDANEQTHVVPDVLVWRAGDGWRVGLSAGAMPKLRVSAHCEQALAGGGSDHTALRGLLDEARWLVRGIAMRNETLLKTAQVLVERQREFLERGEEALAPLTLKEVADAIGMHESTVSRITSGKYIQTPRGTFELKRLFAVRLEGATVGAAAVKAMVKRLIESEPTNAPLADDAIAGLLARQGVRIARRTVAKYRDQLCIAPANLRRMQPQARTMSGF